MVMINKHRPMMTILSMMKRMMRKENRIKTIMMKIMVK